MCNQCSSDPRNELHSGLRALGGLRDLLVEISCSANKGDFKVVQPGNLSELVRMVDDRLQAAGEKLQDYVPRGHSTAT